MIRSLLSGLLFFFSLKDFRYEYEFNQFHIILVFDTF